MRSCTDVGTITEPAELHVSIKLTCLKFDNRIWCRGDIITKQNTNTDTEGLVLGYLIYGEMKENCFRQCV